MAALQAFLKGDDPSAGGQLALGFSPYDFSIIPIETISAIYEKFIEAGDKTRRRQSGAYYTPPHLVELVVDQAIEGWDSLLDKKALDVATGSGIFLVSLFNRMAEQWRREYRGVGNSVLANGLTDILRERLCGVDVSVTACRIATFSLYLALLDQLEPRDIEKLRRAGWQLPRLLKLPKAGTRSDGPHTVIKGNLFDPGLPIDEGSFDLVVGNPPWVSRGQSEDSDFKQWCKNHRERPVPEGQIAHGFMWRAPEFLAARGRACLVLPAAVFVNQTTNAFQREWFRRFAVEQVSQLSDLRHVLFVGSKHPAVVVRFTKAPPVLDEARIEYAVPKADPQSLRGGPVRVFDHDSWGIRQSQVLVSAADEKAPLVWKERLWGTPRDLRFLDRLMDMPHLGDLVSSPKSRKPKRWIKGQGVQPYNPEEIDPKTRKPLVPKQPRWSKDMPFLDAKTNFRFVLLSAETQCVPRELSKLRREADPRLFSPPMVIANDALTRVAFCGFPVLFRQALQSIAGPPEDADRLRLLSAVMNSDLTTYFQFHTAASWGTERTEVHLYEILRMPFPLPEDTLDPTKAKKTMAAVSHRLRHLEANGEKATKLRQQLLDEARADIWPLILDYYDIDDWEEMLIEDTLRVCVRSSTPAGPAADIPALRAPTRDEQEQYASLLCRVLNTWGKGSGYTVNRSIVAPRGGSVGVVTLSKDRASKEPNWSGGSQELNKALAEIAKLLPQRRAGIEVVRGMKVFGKNELHIVKPLMLRFWTRTAALNDADEIASAILRAR